MHIVIYCILSKNLTRLTQPSSFSTLTNGIIAIVMTKDLSQDWRLICRGLLKSKRCRAVFLEALNLGCSSASKHLASIDCSPSSPWQA
ncbi:hypothetical protein FGO68_gene341 [Halteria grandinella]|uniref:Uncharacterized protein n=1 Tax=Halteria grandinella TaxID=5974 RepID=A0A8J8NVH8_HALGN|nr:hypothetical protein FGO68_gene341 [Halteria grandinella]